MKKEKSSDRILFLLHMPPPVHGSSMVGQFIKESNLVNQQFDARYINLLASKTVNDSGKFGLAKIVGLIKTVFHLVKELAFHRPKLCYLALTSTGAAFYRDVLLVTIIKLFGVKLVYHMHNKGVSRFQDHPLHRFFYRFVFKNTPAILLARSLYKDIEAFVPEENVYILPNGIPDNSFLPIERNQNDIVNILFLSNLIESKGVFVLLEALSEFKKENLSFRTTLIGGEGDISKKELTAKIANLNLKQEVVYKGKRFGEEKGEEFSKADIFAFPTYYPNECFPLVLLEAMQHKLPIVTTFEGGIPDMVEDGKNGFLVEQKDADKLAEKLKYLILNPEIRASMGEHGYKNYLENYTLNTFEKRFIKIMIELTSK